MNKHQIYCAGPLFNQQEKNEMETIAKILESNGYKTFLPHRDGLEYSNIFSYLRQKGKSEETLNLIISKAIFALDVYKVFESNGLVLNMNGRVPDEGAMVEAGIAWAYKKKIVIYKNDNRTIINGFDNPLVVGLSCFYTVSEYKQIPIRFDELFDSINSSSSQIGNMIPPIDELISKGENISKYIEDKNNSNILYEKILELFGENE